MEVDRVSQIGGVRQEADPSWTREKMRRRKFVEELPAPENEAEETEQNETDPNESLDAKDEKHEGGLDVMA
jgi:hypothetical protein